MLQGVRPAFVADQAVLAYNRRGPDCEWGLALGDRAAETIIDMVGMIFVPLYQIIGPTSIVDIFILGRLCLPCSGVTTAVGRQGHPNGALANSKDQRLNFGRGCSASLDVMITWMLPRDQYPLKCSTRPQVTVERQVVASNRYNSGKTVLFLLLILFCC
jgi:hypothetical protein